MPAMHVLVNTTMLLEVTQSQRVSHVLKSGISLIRNSCARHLWQTNAGGNGMQGTSRTGDLVTADCPNWATNTRLRERGALSPNIYNAKRVILYERNCGDR
ncbi:hypothetical protein TRVL_09731 [Trypanosoma vivax]|nr:hypothetical protein TRVL_09731 [Trypanosoma vivax]